ncbi:glycosyltransferase [Lachnospiraceae bacterium MD1]|uniref:Glycosyltransferase n=1 Tax=Variimorphobacter saccharofermentans TaxID=2755051 RepID=A0A839K3I8_9FIRM|nr:glycosyltransferase [Variimorphobacter saccharofermentans]MBB2184186.1 glycosyltransferase [Variimorphobacter saccharofermentans]
MNKNNEFLNEILNLVKLVDDNHRNINAFNKLLGNIGKLYFEIDDKNELLESLYEMCNDIPDMFVVLLEYIFQATSDGRVLQKQITVLLENLSKGVFNVFYTNFYRWQIISRLFLLNIKNSLYIERASLHSELVKQTQKMLGISYSLIPNEELNTNRIVLISEQLLSFKHGPSRNLLDYYYTLKYVLKKEVLLLVITEMPLHDKVKNLNYGISYREFYYLDALDGSFSIKYQDETVNGYQCILNEDRLDEIKEIIRYVYNWKPYLVYNMGSENIIADILGSFTNEVTIPFSYEYPVSEGHYLILARNIEDRDKHIVDYLYKRNQEIIESTFVYKLNDPIKKYNREEFDINENSFVVAIVGNRLEYEINDKFIVDLKNVLERNNSVCIVFIGNFDNFDIIKDKIGFNERVKYIGYHEDLRGVLNIADVYLNPPRKGGGTSAVEAMAQGLPVITLGECDVAYAAGENFIYETYHSLPEVISKYKDDYEFYKSRSEQAILQATKVVDTKNVIQNILKVIE